MSKIEPQKIILKNGKTLTLREAKIEDTEKLSNCIRSYLGDSEYLPKLPEEMKIDADPNWIKSYIESDNSLLLVAEYDNQIIGNIDATGSKRKAMEHTAVIGMGMLVEWRNLGLGKHLFETVIQWAKENPKLELLWLQVYTENMAGITLYKKMGFIENGSIKNYFKQKGKYYDNLTMSLKL